MNSSAGARGLVGVFALFLCFLSGYARAYAGEAPSGAELGRRLKTIADSGRLHDPAFVGEVLGLRFVLDAQFEPDTYPCPNGIGEYQVTHARYMARKDGWYRTTPRARDILLANSGDYMKEYLSKHELPAPYARLMIRQTTPCIAGWPLLTEADLDMEGLNAFACYVKPDAAAMIGGSEDVLHTDGASGMEYLGWRSEDAGTRLTFDYFLGSHCAFTIRMRQEASLGYLGQRAWVEFDICKGTAAKRYCAMPEERRKVSRSRYVSQQCGSIQSFTLRQPRTGRPPRPDRTRLADSMPVPPAHCPGPR